MFFRRRKTQQLEKYIVKEPFVLREWGDRKGDTVFNKIIRVGTQIEILPHRGGLIKRIWIDSEELGKYKLVTTKDDIVARCIKR